MEMVGGVAVMESVKITGDGVQGSVVEALVEPLQPRLNEGGAPILAADCVAEQVSKLVKTA